jgi:hypothetical protein
MDGFQRYDNELAAIRIAHIQEELATAEVSNEVLQEAYSDAVRQMLAHEDVGWQKIGQNGLEKGINSIEDARSLADKLEDWCTTNPLLVRANEQRASYLFSQPYEIGTEGANTKITPQQRNIITKRQNQDAIFGLEALTSITSQHFSAGNVFIEYDMDGKSFVQVPFDQIADLIYDPFDRSIVRYVKRVIEYAAMDVRTGVPVRKREEYWLPTSQYTPDNRGYFPKIGDVKVNRRKRMVVSRVNRRVGSVFGIPDSFAAAPWALAYSAYLRDGTKVLAALAEWVWKFTPKKRPAAERAAASVRNERGAGGSLFTDMDVQALPRADAIDLNTGRPLASQVAAATGISVVVLLADPGQSGAYGTAQTLSDPNRRTMQARREVITDLIKECLALIGIKDPAVVWGKMAPGTDAEEVELLSQAWGTGLFHEDEIRPRIAEVAQIQLLHDAPPTGVMLPNNEESIARGDVDTDGSDVDPDGTNSQTNGVGRDNEGLGARSRTRTSRTQSGANTPQE